MCLQDPEQSPGLPHGGKKSVYSSVKFLHFRILAVLQCISLLQGDLSINVMARDILENISLPREANRSRVHLKVKLPTTSKIFPGSQETLDACLSYLHGTKFQGPRVET